VVVPVLVAAGVGAYVLTRPDPRAGSERLPDGSVAVASRTPDAYEIVYRVEDHGPDGLIVSTERVTVRRPFESRTEALEGEPPGGEPIGVQESALSRFATGVGERAVFAIPPSVAAADRRIDRFLGRALDEGVAEERERRRVAGRDCRIVRVGATPGARTLGTLDGANAWTEVCLDEAGLVLEEVVFEDGRMRSRKLAVEVGESPDLPPAPFVDEDPTLGVREGGGLVRPVAADSRPPGTFWELGEVPSGFEHIGRFAVVPPQTGFDDPMARPRITASVVDVWTRGADVLLIDQGGTLEGGQAFDDDPNGIRVDGGQLGDGELLLTPQGAESRFLLGGGDFVRVYGTLSPEEIIGAALALEEREGGEREYLDE